MSYNIQNLISKPPTYSVSVLMFEDFLDHKTSDYLFEDVNGKSSEELLPYRKYLTYFKETCKILQRFSADNSLFWVSWGTSVMKYQEKLTRFYKIKLRLTPGCSIKIYTVVHGVTQRKRHFLIYYSLYKSFCQLDKWFYNKNCTACLINCLHTKCKEF